MYILGLTYSHCATACLLKDGKIIAASSEERFTRKKNYAGIPVEAIRYCLKYANIKASDINEAVIGFNSLPFYFRSLGNVGKFKGKKYLTYYKIKRFYFFIRYTFLPYLIYHFPFLSFLDTILRSPLELLGKTKQPYQTMKKLIEETTDIPSEKISFADHHLCHGLAALYFSPFPQQKKDALVFTCDGQGDGISATVSIFRYGLLKRIAATSVDSSLGFFFLYITQYLGLNQMEDEYKVMGLAPYAKPEHANRAYDILKELIWLDKRNLVFKSKYRSHLFPIFLKNKLSGIRFDAVAAGAQKLLEELLTVWVNETIKRYKIKNIVCGGGTFLNVKANQKIAALLSVKNAYFMPSAGDESTPFGACFLKFLEKTHYRKIPFPPQNLYLGPYFSNEEIQKILNKNNSYSVKFYNNIEKKIATLLAKGLVVGRFAGRMEWGARALGNRSILADAANPHAKETINQIIKERDFWMPFAPTILAQHEKNYIKNPKGISGSYMTIAYPATQSAKIDLAATIHPYDKTVRAQILRNDDNPSFYKTIKYFFALTNRAGILNTSFNLHGYPIVATPRDALWVFKRSKLEVIAIGNYLVRKKYVS